MSATSKKANREAIKEKLERGDVNERAALGLYLEELGHIAKESDWLWADEVVREHYRSRVRGNGERLVG